MTDDVPALPELAPRPLTSRDALAIDLRTFGRRLKRLIGAAT